ncbi:hypothetical protein [Aeromonas veronii]
MEGKINQIIRIGNRVIGAEIVNRPEKQYSKDDIITQGKITYVVDYANDKVIALQLVTHP